jgi:hypothetical protein
MSIQAFTITIAQSILDDLRQRLARTRWSASLQGAGWDYGTNPEYLKELVDYWQHTFHSIVIDAARGASLRERRRLAPHMHGLVLSAGAVPFRPTAHLSHASRIVRYNSHGSQTVMYCPQRFNRCRKVKPSCSHESPRSRFNPGRLTS